LPPKLVLVLNMVNNLSTLVIGASTNPERYAYKAVQLLQESGYPVQALGIKKGEIEGVSIVTDTSDVDPDQVDTISLYLSSDKQIQYKDWILSLAPRRVIFNPGTENPELERLLQDHGITILRACTLVMLRTQQYAVK